MFLGLSHARVHPPPDSFRHPRLPIAALSIPLGQHWLFHLLAFGVVHTVPVRRRRSARFQRFSGHRSRRGRGLIHATSHVVSIRRQLRVPKHVHVQAKHTRACVGVPRIEVPFAADSPPSAAVPVLFRVRVRRFIFLARSSSAIRPPSVVNPPRSAHTHRVHRVDRRRRARLRPTGRKGRPKGNPSGLFEIERGRCPMERPFREKIDRWEARSPTQREMRSLSKPTTIPFRTGCRPKRIGSSLVGHSPQEVEVNSCG